MISELQRTIGARRACRGPVNCHGGDAQRRGGRTRQGSPKPSQSGRVTQPRLWSLWPPDDRSCSPGCAWSRTRRAQTGPAASPTKLASLRSSALRPRASALTSHAVRIQNGPDPPRLGRLPVSLETRSARVEFEKSGWPATRRKQSGGTPLCGANHTVDLGAGLSRPRSINSGRVVWCSASHSIAEVTMTTRTQDQRGIHL